MSAGFKRLRRAKGAEAVRQSVLADNAKATEQVRATRTALTDAHPISKGARVYDKRTGDNRRGTVKLCDVQFTWPKRQVLRTIRGHVVLWDKTGAMELVHRSQLVVVG